MAGILNWFIWMLFLPRLEGKPWMELEVSAMALWPGLTDQISDSELEQPVVNVRATMYFRRLFPKEQETLHGYCRRPGGPAGKRFRDSGDSKLGHFTSITARHHPRIARCTIST